MALLRRTEDDGAAAGLCEGRAEGADRGRAAVRRMAGVLLVSGHLVVALGH